MKVRVDLIEEGCKVVPNRNTFYSILADKPGVRKRVFLDEFDELRWNIVCDKNNAVHALTERQ